MNDLLRAQRRSVSHQPIVLENPSRSQLEQVSAQLGLHPLILANLCAGRQHPKFECIDNHLHFSLWDVEHISEKAHRSRASMSVIFDDRDLLVVHRESGTLTRDVASALVTPGPTGTSSPIARVYGLFAALTNDFVAVGAEIEDELEAVESEVFDDTKKENIGRIYGLRRHIGRIDRAVTGFAEALRQADASVESMTVLDRELRTYFAHLQHTINGVAELVGDAHRGLDAVVASHESNVAMRQNKDMRTISAFAALLAIPTVIAGIYGMNFDNLPPLQWEFGWVAVSIVMVIADVIVGVLFYRKGWIGGRRERTHDAGGDG